MYTAKVFELDELYGNWWIVHMMPRTTALTASGDMLIWHILGSMYEIFTIKTIRSQSKV